MAEVNPLAEKIAEAATRSLIEEPDAPVLKPHFENRVRAMAMTIQSAILPLLPDIESAVKSEREACAKIAEQYLDAAFCKESFYGRQVAAAIRSRASQPSSPEPPSPVPAKTEDAGKSSGFEVKIEFHTNAANEIMRSPDWVREKIGAIIDTHGLEEEIDYTLEVRRLYE